MANYRLISLALTFRATTNSDHNLPVTPNLLNQNFTPTAPNGVWGAMEQ
ncbi:hypothetical protein [Escherichia coli]|nr:hypothetical protein [Escherichia coli]